MNANEIKKRVNQVVRDVLDDESIQIEPELAANDIAGWDSLAHINIIVAIEKDFGIRFNLMELKPLKTIGGLLTLIEKKIG